MTPDQERVVALLERSEPAIAAAFRDLVVELQSAVTLDRLVEFIETGQRTRLVKHLSLLGAKFAADVIQDVFVPSGGSAADTVSTARGVVVAFDITHPAIVQAMRELRLRLVTDIIREQMELINQMIVEASIQGLNPRQLATWIQPHLGLTARQESIVANYRRLLEGLDRQALDRELRDARSDKLIADAIRRKRPLTPAQIDSLVDRYRRRLISYRSRVIAQTEALRGTNSARDAVFAAGVADGLFAREDLVRTWFTASDERVRSSHVFMHGQERGQDEPFLSGLGNSLRYPGDENAPAEDVINCRCIVTTRVKKLSME